MDYFTYQQNQLYAESCALTDLAEQFGTPAYIYSKKTLQRHWHAFDEALSGMPHQICYAVKACSNIAILQQLVALGSGFDIVSGGELARVLAAGGEGRKVVFSGVAKQASELTYALENQIGCINVESREELALIEQVAAEVGVKAPIALRINPDIDAKTHPYISTGLQQNKFGIDFRDALAVYQQANASEHLTIVGISCHIGSQLMTLAPYQAALKRLLETVAQLKNVGILLSHIDLGGGLGVRYTNEEPPSPQAFGAAIVPMLAPLGIPLFIEPGRAIMANAGVLLTRVLMVKKTREKTFVITDAAMNDLLRPSLYGAVHQIENVSAAPNAPIETVDVVGPVCETGDFFAKEVSLAASPGDLLVIRGAGAYGFSMSSQYNSRPRACEVLVSDRSAHLIRARETISDLFAHERLL